MTSSLGAVTLAIMSASLAACGTDALTTGDAGAPPGVVADARGGVDGTTSPLRPDEVPQTGVFSGSVLHRISLTLTAADLEALTDFSRPPDELRRPAMMTVDGRAIGQVGVRRKGSSGSLDPSGEKPALSIKLDAFVANQRLDGLDKVLLNNAKQDPTFLAEHVGYEAYRRLGAHAPRTSFALVTINGRPRGLYVVREPVDREFFRLRYGKDDDDGNLYEGSVADFATTRGAEEIELKHEAEERRSRADVRTFASALARSNADSLESLLDAQLDVASFTVSFAVDTTLRHIDGYSFGINNHYVYRRPSTQRFVHVPHGMDQLFSSGGLDLWSLPSPNEFGNPSGMLTRRMLADGKLRARVARDFEALRAALAALPAWIDERAAPVENVSGLTGVEAEDVAALGRGVTKVKSFLSQRAQRLP